MKAALSRKIRAKIDGHPTHSELVAWAEAAERLQIDWIEEKEDFAA